MSYVISMFPWQLGVSLAQSHAGKAWYGSRIRAWSMMHRVPALVRLGSLVAAISSHTSLPIYLQVSVFQTCKVCTGTHVHTLWFCRQMRGFARTVCTMLFPANWGVHMRSSFQFLTYTYSIPTEIELLRTLRTYYCTRICKYLCICSPLV